MTDPAPRERPQAGQPPSEPGPIYPDPRPLRRMQAVTFALIAVVALVTLLSDSRPAAVRWGAAAGVAVLVVAAALVLRHRRTPPRP